MTVLASINLNKRFNSAETRSNLHRWLLSQRAEILLAQEPWKVPPKESVQFSDFMPIGGNNRVFAWFHARCQSPAIDTVEDFCQRIELDYLVVYNIYLDAYDCGNRATQLSNIQRKVITERDRPVLILGDFNIAPEPSDGLVDGIISSFNSEIDRGALRQLLDVCHLVDLGRNIGPQKWTIERDIGGRKIQFRCDLALASDYISQSIGLHYDHTTRVTQEHFTDHTGLLLELPVTIPEAEHQPMLFPSDPIDPNAISKVEIRPEKTAIHRTGPSSIARQLNSIIRDASISSILDYGCGYGEDVNYYRTSGLIAEGYDPYPLFGWSVRPSILFDLVTVIFVLNVLPDPWERLKVIQEAAKYVSPHGLMVVASRSPDEIRHQAETKNWKFFNDGYWSHEGKGTFQHGLSKEEIIAICNRAGFTVSHYERSISSIPGTTCVVLERRVSASSG